MSLIIKFYAYQSKSLHGSLRDCQLKKNGQRLFFLISLETTNCSENVGFC